MQSHGQHSPAIHVDGDIARVDGTSSNIGQQCYLTGHHPLLVCIVALCHLLTFRGHWSGPPQNLETSPVIFHTDL